MAQISEITVEDLLKVRRFDADFFRADYLQYENELKAIDHNKFEDIAYVTDGDHGSPDFDDSSNIIYLSAKTVKNNYFDLSNAETISEEQHKRNKRSSLKEGDIILSTVGTIGNVAVVQKEMLPGNMDRHVGLIRLNNLDNEKPYFYSAFLDSKYGRFQSMRHSTGNVQLNLFISKMNEFIVPEWNEQAEKIAKEVKRGYELRQKSKSLYAQAEQLLLQELGLENFTPEWVAGYETDFDNVLDVARMDAEYFQPRYELLMEKIGNSNKIEKLGNISTLSKKKVNILPEETYKYIEIGDVDTSNGEFTYNEIAGVDLPANAKKSIQDESLLISTVRPTRGAVGVIPNGWNNGFVVSGAFAVFEKHSISPFYLQVVMRSIIGKVQLERRCTGVSYPTVTDEDVANVVIPLLDDEKIKKIHDLVTESHKSLHESRQLLEHAKREVEEMIESKAN